MASFSLRSQRTGQYKEFTLLELLKLLGDEVNDEIWLENGEDVYNLSSFRELGGGGDGSAYRENWSVEAPGQTAGQRTFYLRYFPSTSVLMVILNGIVQSLNKDYILEGNAITFAFPLNGQDNLQFIYQF